MDRFPSSCQLAGLAQLVERWSHNPKVVSSILTPGSFARMNSEGSGLGLQIQGGVTSQWFESTFCASDGHAAMLCFGSSYHWLLGVLSKKRCSMWGSNPRPLAHKTNTLPTELMERVDCDDVQSAVPTKALSNARSWSSGYDRRLPSDGPGFNSRRTQFLLFFLRPNGCSLALSECVCLDFLPNKKKLPKQPKNHQSTAHHHHQAKSKKKVDSTPHCSRVVPHPSTERAQTALTSVFG